MWSIESPMSKKNARVCRMAHHPCCGTYFDLLWEKVSAANPPNSGDICQGPRLFVPAVLKGVFTGWDCRHLGPSALAKRTRRWTVGLARGLGGVGLVSGTNLVDKITVQITT